MEELEEKHYVKHFKTYSSIDYNIEVGFCNIDFNLNIEL